MSRADLLQLLETVRSLHFGPVVPFPGTFRGDDRALSEHVLMLMRLLSDEDLQHVSRKWCERDEVAA